MANGNFAGGTGVENDPYLIEDADDLNAIREDLSSHYKMVSDIDLNIEPYNIDPGWEPIGTVTDPFVGSLDGGWKKIKNLYINRNDTIQSFISSIDYGGNIKNLGLENIRIECTGFSSGIAYYLKDGLIENCYVTGVIMNSSSNTYNQVRCGGMVSYMMNNGGHIKNCWANVNVDGPGEIIGGLVGDLTYGIVENCYSYGVVTSDTSVDVGGLIGKKGNDGTSTGCFWDKEVSGIEVSSSGTGLTTLEMKTPQVFIDAGWDQEVWLLKNSEYPHITSHYLVVGSLLESEGILYIFKNNRFIETNDFQNEGMSYLSPILTPDNLIKYGMDYNIDDNGGKIFKKEINKDLLKSIKSGKFSFNL
jgi:hypothetical protein